MPIEHHKSGGTTITGKSIDYFRMAQLLSGLALEIRTGGRMKVARGVNCWMIIKREYGLKGSREKVYTAFQAMVEGRQANQMHVDPDGTVSGGTE